MSASTSTSEGEEQEVCVLRCAYNETRSHVDDIYGILGFDRGGGGHSITPGNFDVPSLDYRGICAVVPLLF